MRGYFSIGLSELWYLSRIVEIVDYSLQTALLSGISVKNLNQLNRGADCAIPCRTRINCFSRRLRLRAYPLNVSISFNSVTDRIKETGWTSIRVIHSGRRRDEKVMISGALTLLTNAVMAYNTWKLHQVLERGREAGQPVPSDEILAHIAPIAFRHINFQGIYRFPLERYLDRLLPSVLPRKIAASAK